MFVYTKCLFDLAVCDKMDLYVIIVFILVFLLSYIYFSKPKGLPPGPRSVPIIGSVAFLNQLRKGQPHVVFMNAAKQYGSVFSFEFATQLIVVLNGYETIYQALVKQGESFNDRPTFLRLFKSALKDGKGIVFQNYNQEWKILRRFTLQTLRDFGVGKTSIEEKITIEVKAASEVLESIGGTAIEMVPILQNIIGNVIYGILFGTRYDYDDPQFKLIRHMMVIAGSGQSLVGVASFLPEWVVRRYGKRLIPMEYSQLKNMDDMKQFVYDIIKQHGETFDENHIRDFVDLYVQVSRDSNEKEREIFTKSNMMRVILDLFFAGYETTSNTLDWALLRMSEHPEVQKRCQAEIDNLLGDKQVEYVDRGKLKYVEATLMEIQRLASIAPFALHSTTENTKLMGYNIPRNTIVLPNYYSSSLDPAYWDDPNKFDPRRFLDEKGNVVKREPLIPFSVGPRACLGEPLARMELFIVFVHMIQHFHFEREYDDFRHSMKPQSNKLTLAPLPYKLRVIQRK